MSQREPAAFVRATTRPGTPPLVPEIRLHLADEAFALWERLGAELGRADLPPPFWAFAWAGGQGLARYVLDHPGLVGGRTVLDLASGSGLVAIAAALAGAAAVTASDVDPFAGAAMALNAAANGVAVGVRLEDLLDGDGEGAEVVLAGDVFYERPLADRVLPFLVRAWARGAEVVVGDPGRTYFPPSDPPAVGVEEGAVSHPPRPRLVPLAAYDVPVARSLEGSELMPTTVWRLAR